MPADVHGGQEHNTLQSEAGYIDARRQADRLTKTYCNARPHHTLGSIQNRGVPGAADIGLARLNAILLSTGLGIAAHRHAKDSTKMLDPDRLGHELVLEIDKVVVPVVREAARIPLLGLLEFPCPRLSGKIR
jgi:hypothetical protein